jgi:hypothetical protein
MLKINVKGRFGPFSPGFSGCFESFPLYEAWEKKMRDAGFEPATSCV